MSLVWEELFDWTEADPDFKEHSASFHSDVSSSFDNQLNTNFKVSLSFVLRTAEEDGKWTVGVRNCDWETYFAMFDAQGSTEAKGIASVKVKEFLGQLVSQV